MTVERIVTPESYIGVSTDTKPTHVRAGASFYERDTESTYVTYDGYNWVVDTKKIEGKPRVSAIPYAYDIAELNVPDHFPFNKFGHNDAVAATLETIWSAGGLYPYMTVADQLEILSSNDEDGGAGTDTGALTMDIFGVDSSYNEISETITLNGSTVVTSVKSYLRIYRAIVRTAGSTGWNIGTITIRDQDTDITRATVEPLKNQTLMAVFTIPSGYTGFITTWYGGTILAKDTELELYVRPFGEVLQVKRNMHIFRNSFRDEIDFPERVTEKSDIEIRGLASGGGGDISAGFFLWYEKN